MSNDLQQLSKLIQMPVKPTSVKWIQSSPQGPGGDRMGPRDYTIVALLELSAADIEVVRAKSGPPPDNEPLALTDKELPHFFTAAEAAKWERPSPGFIVVPGKTYGPAAFAKGSFLHGKVAILDGRPNQVLLSLYTN